MARLFREVQLPESLGRFSRSFAWAAVILRFSGLPGRGGILPGITLCRIVFRERRFDGMRRFPSALAGRLHAREGTV